MNEDRTDPLDELSREDVEEIFEDAIQSVGDLQNKMITINEDIGYAHHALKALLPRTLMLYDQAGEDESIYPVVYSGVKYVQALGAQFRNYDSQAQGIQIGINRYANSTGTVMSSTDATAYLISARLPEDILEIPQQIPRKSREEYINKLKKTDPSLGNAYEEIWQIYYGTTADKCRASLFMIRQVFDHFFNIFAPDDEVRRSDYWTEKDGDKPMQVYRQERIQYVANTHIQDAGVIDALISSSRNLLDMYDVANKAHTRGSLNEPAADKAFHAMNQILMDWFDAIL